MNPGCVYPNLITDCIGNAACIRAAPHDLAVFLDISSLDLLHLITSLAYLLLLIGGSGLRFVFYARHRARPPVISDTRMILLGYILPGLVGLLPILLTLAPLPAGWVSAWSFVHRPEFLWAPATQVFALAILLPQAKAPRMEVKKHPPFTPAIALLLGLVLWLLIAFVTQLIRTLVAPQINAQPPSGMLFFLAMLASLALPFLNERYLRGRFLQESLKKNRPPTRSVLLHAVLCGLLTFRPAAILPTALASVGYSYLSIHEGKLRSAILAHLAFNLASFFFSTSIIH